MHRFLNSSLAALLLLLLGVGCGVTRQPGKLTQVSTIDALLAGSYDGQMTIAELAEYGDFGLGTWHGLDGEMVVYQGNFYQVRADGKVYRPGPQATTPFAAVLHFEPNRTTTIPAGTDFAALSAAVDRAAPNQNLFCAIRVHGRLKSLHTRSVPRQRKPYPPLAEVTRHQPEFRFQDVNATIIGLRCPAYVKGIGVTGYHLHAITDDGQAGGHILGFEFAEGAQVDIEVTNEFYLILPADKSDFATLDLSRDRSQELHEVEH